MRNVFYNVSNDDDVFMYEVFSDTMNEASMSELKSLICELGSESEISLDDVRASGFIIAIGPRATSRFFLNFRHFFLIN